MERFRLYLIYLVLEWDYRGLEPLNGLFRVVYKDGEISQRMYYRNAKNYASIFSGKVIYYKNILK